MYKKHKDKFGLIIDWETSGSNWDMRSNYQYQGISLGAIVFDTVTLQEVKTFYVEIMFNPDDGLNYITADRTEKLNSTGDSSLEYKWSNEAQAIHGLSMEHLLENGVTQEDAATDFLNFVSEFWPLNDTYNKILMLAHNRQFDLGFMEQLMISVGLDDFMNSFNITELDASALGWFLLGLHKSDDIFDYLELPPRVTHNALEDCSYTLQSCRILRELFSAGTGITVTDVI